MIKVFEKIDLYYTSLHKLCITYKMIVKLLKAYIMDTQSHFTH